MKNERLPFIFFLDQQLSAKICRFLHSGKHEKYLCFYSHRPEETRVSRTILRCAEGMRSIERENRP